MKYAIYMLNMMLALALLSATPFTKFLINSASTNNSSSLTTRHIANKCLEIYRYNPSQAYECNDLKQKINQFENYQKIPLDNNPSNFYREL